MIDIYLNGTSKRRCQGYAPTAYLVNIMLPRLKGYAPSAFLANIMLRRLKGYAPTAYLVNIMLRRLEGYAPEHPDESQNNWLVIIVINRVRPSITLVNTGFRASRARDWGICLSLHRSPADRNGHPGRKASAESPTCKGPPRKNYNTPWTLMKGWGSLKINRGD